MRYTPAELRIYRDAVEALVKIDISLATARRAARERIKTLRIRQERACYSMNTGSVGISRTGKCRVPGKP